MADNSLTKAEVNILKSVAEAGRAGKERVTIHYIADRAGVSIDVLYKKLQDSKFRGLFIDAMRGSLVAEAPAILQKFVELAKEGYFKHGKLVLEIAGIYTENKNINLDAKVDNQINPFKTSEERQEFLQSLIRKTGTDKTDKSE